MSRTASGKHSNAALRQRDIRLRAIVITLALVLLTGFGLYLLPGKTGTETPLQMADPAPFRPDARFDKQFRDAALLLHRKEYGAALEAWEGLVEKAPQMPETWVNLGYTLLGLNRHQVAEQVFQKAISLRSSQANAYYGLALALEGQDKYSDAAFNMQAFVERSAKTDPYVKVAREKIRTLMNWAAERQSCEPEAPTGLNLVDNTLQGISPARTDDKGEE